MQPILKNPAIRNQVHRNAERQFGNNLLRQPKFGNDWQMIRAAILSGIRGDSFKLPCVPNILLSSVWCTLAFGRKRQATKWKNSFKPGRNVIKSLPIKSSLSLLLPDYVN
jgi:hypothetical protein